MIKRLDTTIKWLIVGGFITLPYTHFKWIPDLGTTRPVAIFFFAAAFGLVMLKGVVTNRGNPKNVLHWMLGWDNWPMLRWWVGLIVLGVLSTIATFFYGLPVQALLRLLGYVAIFVTLFIGAYSLPRFGIRTIARYIVIGYLPVLVYAAIEVLSLGGNGWAWTIVSWVRNNFIVPFPYSNRLTLLATEPSFVPYQLLLLVLLLPFVSERWLRWSGWALVVIVLVYTKSATLFGLTIIYLSLWGLFSLRRPLLAWLTGIVTGVMGAGILANWLVPAFSNYVQRVTNAWLHTGRIFGWINSGSIRLSYIMSLVYTIVDTHGIGLGIGQYGLFWKDIYLRHINYQAFDWYGEVATALRAPISAYYMKPWSVILGVGVDLGLLGLVLLVGFFWQIFRMLTTPRHRALFFTCLVALASAYPIVTPHVWLALALLAGFGSNPLGLIKEEKWDLSGLITKIKGILIRNRKRTTIFSLLLSIILILMSTIVMFNQANAKTVWRTQSLTLEGVINPLGGYAYEAHTGHSELSVAPNHPSPALVLEDGIPLPGPANTTLDPTISKIGKGSYCFWLSMVIFSTSDNSDPRTNGRHYEFSYPVTSTFVGKNTAFFLYFITVLVIAFTIVWLAMNNIGKLKRNRKRTTIISIILSTILFLTSTYVMLNQASPVSPWRTQSLTLEGAINPLGGYAYEAYTGHPELSVAPNHPSPALVLEDGIPLPGPADANPDTTITKIGKGSYCFWKFMVLFSTSDNSDPRTNGRYYEISYPVTYMGNFIAFSLYFITVLVVAFTIVWLVNKNREFSEKEKSTP